MENNNVKNLRVNHRNVKKTLAKGVAITLVFATFVAGHFTVKAINKYPDTDKNRVKIEQYYGENSNEFILLQYLDLWEKLNTLNLDEYTVSNSNVNLLGENIDNVPSVDKVNATIDDFTKSYLTNHDIDNDIDYCKTVINLKQKRDVLSNYIKEEYNNVYNEYVSSLKKYIAEYYGIPIEDSENILLSYGVENGSGEQIVTLEYKGSKALISSPKIKNMVFNMILMQRESNNIDNMKEALIKAQLGRSKFETENDNNDLYNEKAASKFRIG